MNNNNNKQLIIFGGGGIETGLYYGNYWNGLCKSEDS